MCLILSVQYILHVHSGPMNAKPTSHPVVSVSLPGRRKMGREAEERGRKKRGGRPFRFSLSPSLPAHACYAGYQCLESL